MPYRDLTVKQRVLLHLFDFTRFEDAYDVPAEVTQSGIAQAVGIRVHHVTQYANPLIEEGLIIAKTSHVRQRPRRRRAYFLGPKGRTETAALRDLLLREEVPFRGLDGAVKSVLLEKIYQEERHGTRLLTLLEELRSQGFIGTSLEGPSKGIADFTQEAPKVDRFYGREKELESVLASLERVPVVAVTGLAGMGKTTFGAKVCETLRGRRSLFWREIRPWDTGLDLAVRVSAFLAALGRRGLHVYLAGPRAKEWSRIEELLAVDLAGLGIVLVFDDVQRAAPDAEAFLSILHRALKATKGPAVLLMSRAVPRFYSRKDVEIDHSVEETSLKGLDRESGRRLLEEAGVSAPMRDGLVAACGGVPLFLKLVACSATPTTGEVSGTLETYLTEEVEPSLDSVERECLEVASFYAIPVSSSALLLEEPTRRRIVTSLERKGLLDRTGADTFALHEFLRTYFHRSLSEDRRGAVANRVVRWLEDQAAIAATAGRPGEAMSLLGNAVAVDAGVAGRRRNLEGIGDLRRRIGDPQGALESYRAALNLAERAEDHARLHQKSASMHVQQGHLEEAGREVEAGLRALPAKPSLEAGWLLFRRAQIAHSREDNDHALPELSRVAEWMSGLPPDPALWGNLANLRGIIHLHDTKHMDLNLARSDFQTAAESFEAAGDLAGLSRACNNLGLAALEEGKPEEAIPYLDRSAAIAASLGDLPGRQIALQTKAVCLSENFGRHEEAEALFREAYRLAKSASMVEKIRWLHYYFAQLYRRQGRFEEAKESLEYLLRESKGLLLTETRVHYILSPLVRTCLLCGDTSGAERYVRQAEGLTAMESSAVASHHLAWAQGAFFASVGEGERASAAFHRAEALATFGWHGEFLLEYGEFLGVAGDREEARQVLRKARDALAKDSLMPLLERAEAALHRL